MDHWIAMDAMKGAKKHNDENPSIFARWMSDERYRNFQLAIGWTETYCRCLDCFTTVDITHSAPHHQRKRHESTVTMKCNDPNLQSGSRSETNRTTKQPQNHCWVSAKSKVGPTLTSPKLRGPDRIILPTGLIFFLFVVDTKAGDKTLNGKITNGTIINGEIIHGDQ